MRNYITQEYRTLVENIDSSEFQNYIQKEIEFIKKSKNASKRTFIELGAGYGRVIPPIIDYVDKYIGIELNPNMFDGLALISKQNKKVTAINGDIKNLSKLLNRKRLNNAVIMLLQNTLGALEGNRDEIIDEIKKFTQNKNTELIISVLKAEKLKSFGVNFYSSIEKICGKPDFIKSDFNKGLFYSSTEYTSKWWTKNEIDDICVKLNGNIEEIAEGNEFFFYRISFKNSPLKILK